MPSLLEVRDVSVRFGGVSALSNLSFDVPVGEVTGLIGPNGAGKTTCFNVITGLQSPNSGRVFLDGADITRARPYKRARLGVGRTFQRLETFRTLTARENVLLGSEMSRRRRAVGAGLSVDDIIEQVGIGAVADECVETLPTGTQRLVELGRALATSPRIVLLDEPSSGLDDDETATLGALLVELAARGLAVLLVEHDMRFVMSTCHMINVLDFGQIIATGTPEAVQQNPAVRAAYLGEGPHQARPDASRVVAPPLAVEPVSNGDEHQERGPALELRGVRAGYGLIDVIEDLSFTAKAGEVLAILGPNGAGKSTALKVACGEVRPKAGEVLLHGQRVNGAHPDDLARRGVCCVPAGRGIFPTLTVAEHLAMCTHTGTSLKVIQDETFARFPQLAQRRRQVAGTLSGGEQQMLAMARALTTRPDVLLLDELSMGLAPLVVEALYEEVARIALGDIAIVIVEQFAHDVLAIADHAIVVLHGRVVLHGTPEDVAAGLDAAYLGLDESG
jgi:branched-chain amino acid transport system ATP-binding protein